MEAISSTSVPLQATSVPYVTADEAFSLMTVELERFLSLVDTLDPADWSRPTACTAWTVREILAHQAGGYSSGTGYREMVRQLAAPRKPGQLPEDSMNALQVSERASRSPAELIAELRAVGPFAIQKWAYQFRMIKPISIPHPVPGSLSVRHLMWVTHSRDTWMHRLDICRATGRAFEQTVEHDGRIAALIMLDVEKALRRKLGEVSLIFELSGIAGGTWIIGTDQPAAVIQMDVLDFNILASGRFTYEEGYDRARFLGDIALASKVLKHLLILY
jgi:uncharacterized protein (TIGR03083 family)